MARLGRGFPVQVRTSKPVVAAAAGTTLVVADLTSAATLDAPVLVEVGTLSVANLTSAATIDNLALTQVHNIAIDNFVSPTTLSTITFPAVVPYPITVSGRHLLDQYSNPITIRDMAMWGWPQCALLSEFEDALDAILANGGGWNAVMLTPFGLNPTSYGASPAWDQWGAENGDDYFTGTPLTSTLGTAWDTVFIPMMQACYDRGLIPLVSMYTGYNNTQGWGADLVAIGTTAARTLGNRIATKLAGLPFVWDYTADYDYNWSTDPATQVDALFRGIRDGEAAAGDPARLIICEPSGVPSERSGYSQFINQAQPGVGSTGYGWMIPSINSWYHYGSDTTVAAETNYAESSLPTGNCEPYYRNAGWNGTAPTAQQLREEIYASMVEGASWVNWGDRDICIGPNHSTTALGSDGSVAADLASNDVKYAGWAFAQMAAYTVDTTYAPSAFLTGGVGTGASKAASGNSDTKALAYFPDSRGSITVNTSLLTGTANVRLRWYDPTANTFTSIATSEAQNASRAVTHPGNNTAGDGDWLLVVDLAPIDLVIADLTSAGTLGSLALTQTHILTVAGLTSASTIDNVALIVDLAIASLTSAGTLDNLALTQLHVLTVGDLTSASTLDALTLSFGVSLVTADLTSAATLDALTLTQVHVLAVADLTSASTLDALTLTYIINLVVAGLTSASALDNLDLGGTGTLTIDGLVSAASMDNVVLSTPTILVIADLASLTDLEQVAFDPGITIVVADLASITTIDSLDLTQEHNLTVANLASLVTLQNVTFLTGTVLGKIRGEWVL